LLQQRRRPSPHPASSRSDAAAAAAAANGAGRSPLPDEQPAQAPPQHDACLFDVVFIMDGTTVSPRHMLWWWSSSWSSSWSIERERVSIIITSST
jgi:hypothetical protein